MKLYKDVFTRDELLTDTFPIREINDGIIYEVDAKYITLTTENDFNIGGNASKEGEDSEQLESEVKQVINIVQANRLTETSYDKKSYMAHIKAYMGKVKERVPEDQVAAFQAAAQAWVKKSFGIIRRLCILYR
jgi:hypothetical protein